MIFHVLEYEPIVQTFDKTRLDATKAFVSKDEQPISAVEIEPETGSGFITVTGTSSEDWFLDWQYSTAGTKIVTLRITTNGAPVSKAVTIEAVAKATEKLWSTDQDLVAQEPEILRYVRPGRSSYIDLHRSVQTKILDWVASMGIRADDKSRLTKDDFLVTDELRQLSTYWVLELIFGGISNKPDDTFREKQRFYHGEVTALKNLNIIQPDLNKNGTIDESDKINLTSISAVRG